jgi:phenylpropionate dioxygenase-like ring-hydroxylating dioxygenase large terminal subunit
MNANVDRPAKITEPRLRGDPITGERFTSPDYLRQEWARMWMRTWHIGGVAYQAPQPGDYLVENLGPESFLMVRQDDGKFRAFFNVCSHRGTRLLQGPDGHIASRITCPYHGWQFDCTGTLKALPNASDFRQGDPRGKANLTEIQCEELFGFVWFNADKKAPSLKEFLGREVVEEIGSYKMEEMVRVLDITAVSNNNWKIITDNFNEAYHVQVLHPELIPYIENDGDTCQFDLLKNGHNRGWFPAYQPAVQYNHEAVGEPLISLMAEWGLDSSKYHGKGEFRRIRTDIQKQKRKLGPGRGYKHYDHLTDYQLTDYVIYNLFPNSVITVGPDGVQLLRPRPHATDPGKCYFDHWWLVPQIAGRKFTPSPAGGPDLPVEDAAREVVQYGEKSLGVTADQDLSIAAVQQAGLHSAGFRGFYLSHQERRVQAFHEALNDFVGRAS